MRSTLQNENLDMSLKNNNPPKADEIKAVIKFTISG